MTQKNYSIATGLTLAGLVGLCLICAPSSKAEFPVHNMDDHSLGIQYGLTFRGQNITETNVPAHEILHLVTLAYAPVPYVALEAGLGIDKFSVDRSNQVRFRGDYGLSPAFGLSLFSPAIVDMLRVTAGSKALFLNSEDAKGYHYSGFISTPFFGLIVSPSRYVDVAVGARMLLTDGNMRGPNTQASAATAFANQDFGRGYLSVTLKSPAERAFLTFDFDASPSFETDWSNGPRESTLGVSFGAALGWKSTGTGSRDSSVYFPAYPAMKAKQDKMAEEIQ